MAPHSSTLAWKITWTEEPGRLLSMGSHLGREDPLEKGMVTYSDILQYSCLGNFMNRGAWQATVHGVTKDSDMT